MILRVSFLLFFGGLLTPLAAWEESYSKAVEKARVEGKPLLIAFLGSSWCPWSKKFAGEVLDKQEFEEAAAQSMVCLRLEYRDQPQLSERYQVESVPTLLLVTPAEEEMARFGYLPFKPEECALHLSKAVKAYDALVCIRPLAASVEGLRAAYEEAAEHHLEKLKREFLRAGLEKDSGPYFKVRAYAQMGSQDKKKAKKLRREIEEQDYDNRQGSHLDLALSDFQKLADEQVGVEKTIKPLKKYLRGFGKTDSKNAWRVHMILAQYLFSHGKVAEAVKHGKQSLVKAPEEAKESLEQQVAYFSGSGQ